MKILKNFLFTIIFAELVIYLMILDLYGLAMISLFLACVFLNITVLRATRTIFGLTI